jgi:hypothetical protein
MTANEQTGFVVVPRAMLELIRDEANESACDATLRRSAGLFARLYSLADVMLKDADAAAPPAAEPVAWRIVFPDGRPAFYRTLSEYDGDVKFARERGIPVEPLYLHPPTPEPRATPDRPLSLRYIDASVKEQMAAFKAGFAEPRATEGLTMHDVVRPLGSPDDLEFAADPAPAPLTEDPLRYEIDNGRLVVSIGVNTLADALQQGPEWGNEFRITDAAVFAQAVVAELETDEDEIGETSITRALTQAAERAIESAADGVEEIAAMTADQAKGNPNV